MIAVTRRPLEPAWLLRFSFVALSSSSHLHCPLYSSAHCLSADDCHPMVVHPARPTCLGLRDDPRSQAWSRQGYHDALPIEVARRFARRHLGPQERALLRDNAHDRPSTRIINFLAGTIKIAE